MHSIKGNIQPTKILQLNSSNSDFKTKADKLLTTIEQNKAAITIVSEANIESTDQTKTDERKAKFKIFI